LAATPATAEILANSSEPTNAFLLARATAANATDEIRARAAAGEPVRMSPTTYVLDGSRKELERHTGHLVEVTGTLRMVSEGDKANRTTVAHFQVASIKMFASQPLGTARRCADLGDFDGDGKPELTVWRPSNTPRVVAV
jgi:hypothetical protein